MTAKTKKVTIPQALKAELASLSSAELEAVGKLVASMTGGKFVVSDKVTKVDTGGQHSQAESLYTAMADYMYTETRQRVKPFQILLASQDNTAKLAVAKAKEFDKFLDEATGKHELTIAERLKFYTIAANLIGAALKDMKVVFTMSTMLNWLDKAPVLFDREFPSYIKSGLLHMVVFATLQKRVKGKAGHVKEGKTQEAKQVSKRAHKYRRNRDAANAARRQQYK
ncbi:MAG: hypothetical protein GY833_22000 [Aestuariibacter sp.]|nr:hypothetical protein [Aestuariibacter sp.]|tara:strand:+ start:74001 stop:74675 length:675 start_codon:yes stop_codon:yes gene_type:complete